MKLAEKRWIRRMLVGGICVLAALGIAACGGSSSSSDDGVSFPNPTLPAGARVIAPGEAQGIAEDVVDEIDTFAVLAALRGEVTPSRPDVLGLLSDLVRDRVRDSVNVATGVTEDISADICVDGGKAIVNSTETNTSESGNITFSSCNIGFGILLDGKISFSGSFNDTTLDYSIRIGGTLSISDGVETVTLVMDFSDNGNDGTGDFTVTVSYSITGIPGGGYLVTTVQPLVGNAFSEIVTSGQLIVAGGSGTRIRITVVSGNTADVEFDDGSGGGFLPVTNIPLGTT